MRKQGQRDRWVRTGLGSVWILALGATVFALHALGHGRLSAPPSGSFERLRSWLDGRDTPTAAFALVRLGTLLVASYLLVATLLGLTVRRLRNPRLMRLADLAILPIVRRLLATVAGFSLSASTAALVAVPVGSHDGRPAATAPSAATDPSTATGAGPAKHEVVVRRLSDGSTAVMQRIPPPHDDGHGTATMRVIEDRPSSPPQPVVAPVNTWTVHPGDHFWSVATRVLNEAWRRPPTDAEVLPYWHLLVEHNRSRLVDPANADLVYAGQVFELPPPPPTP